MMVAGKKPVKEGRPDITYMGIPGGAGGIADPNRLSYLINFNTIHNYRF